MSENPTNIVFSFKKEDQCDKLYKFGQKKIFRNLSACCSIQFSLFVWSQFTAEVIQGYNTEENPNYSQI